MTKEMKEKISNRLVLNFGVLLGAALILLYVRSALSSAVSGITYIILLILGILCLIGSAVMFILGKKSGSAMKNYSAIPFGTAVGTALLYLSKFNFISGYTWKRAVILVYILMAAYFIVMAIYTAVLLHKPTIKPKDEAELLRKKYAKKKKKKK